MQCRVAPSLGPLEGTHKEVWGTGDHIDSNSPCVFMGVYGLPDFYTLWRHEGKRYILWCGTDITHFIHGYWLDKNGIIKVDPFPLAKWINEYCESWVENKVEYNALKAMGIESKICPSFMGDVKNFDISYKWSPRPRVYASVSGDNFDQYKWPLIEEIAKYVPEVLFYLYGNEKRWRTRNRNVIVRGRVPKEIMNNEIKNMQCGLRLLEFDGFSEVLAKSVLMGQYPISRIEYPKIANYQTKEDLIKKLKELKEKKKPNISARNYYLRNLNKYPWKK
jgi:hypothetical protein